MQIRRKGRREGRKKKEERRERWKGEREVGNTHIHMRLHTDVGQGGKCVMNQGLWLIQFSVSEVLKKEIVMFKNKRKPNKCNKYFSKLRKHLQAKIMSKLLASNWPQKWHTHHKWKL